jgi:hypothetical protein
MVGGGCVGDWGAIEGDLEGPGGVQDVDPFEGVFGVDVDGGVFFVELVCGRLAR